MEVGGEGGSGGGAARQGDVCDEAGFSGRRHGGRMLRGLEGESVRQMRRRCDGS